MCYREKRKNEKRKKQPQGTTPDQQYGGKTENEDRSSVPEETVQPGSEERRDRLKNQKGCHRMHPNSNALSILLFVFEEMKEYQKLLKNFRHCALSFDDHVPQEKPVHDDE